MLYRRFGKRVIDMILSFLGIILLSPLFLIISILIKIDSKGPVIFKHKRLGKNCKPIYVLKFRTMVDNIPVVMIQELLKLENFLEIQV